MRRGLVFMMVIGVAATVIFSSAANAQTNVVCDGKQATIVGTPGSDFLVGTDGPDVIAGLQGNDTIAGQGGDDIICGGFGDDVLYGGLGFDVIFGAQGNDLIYARGTSATITTTTAEGEILTLTLTETSIRNPILPTSVQDELGGRIFAGAGDDEVYGSNRWDRMQGGPGDDDLYGFGGNDWIRGGPGKDRVFGHLGADDLGGGTGTDWIAADKRDLVVRAGAGRDRCPTITSATQWRGCIDRIGTHPTDPTLPDAPLPSQLSGGTANTYVFYTVDPASGVFSLGSTTDMQQVFAERLGHPIAVLTKTPVTAGQAAAIEQRLRHDRPQFDDGNDAISPNASYYSAAIAWGLDWLVLHSSL